MRVHLLLLIALGSTALACSSLETGEASQALTGDAGIGADGGGNRPPVAIDDAVTTDMGMPVGVYVLGNDSDPDGDALTVSLTGASDWPFSRTTFDCWSDGNCWIEAYPHEHGTGSFGYQACDPGGLCAEAMVTVTINHIPVNAYAEDDTATTEVDTAVDIDVLANDTDNDAGWDFSSLWFPHEPFYGTATAGWDGWVTYTPGEGYRGSHVFQYEICNRDGRCDRAWVYLFVDPGSPLVARADSATVYAGYQKYLTPTENDSSPPVMTSVQLLVPPEHGTASTDGYAIYYDSEPDYLGPDFMVYAICLEDGSCAASTIQLTVRGNQEPVVVPDFVHTNEDTPVDFNALANDYDPDGDPLHLQGPCEEWEWPWRNTRLSCSEQGLCYLETQPLEIGYGSARCVVCDELYCVEEIVPIQIDRVPNPPEAYDDAGQTDEDTPVELNVLANDAFNGGRPVPDTMTFTGPSHGSAVVDVDTGWVTYTPAANYAGPDSFVYHICDIWALCASATVTMSVTAVEDPPAYTSAATNTYQRIGKNGTPVALQAVDPDGPASLTFSRVGGALPNNLTLNANGTFASSAGHHKGTYTSTIQVTDPTGLSAQTTLVIVVQ